MTNVASATETRLRDSKAVRSLKDGQTTYNAIYKVLISKECFQCSQMMDIGQLFTKHLRSYPGQPQRTFPFCRACVPFDEEIDEQMRAILQEFEKLDQNSLY